MKTFHCALIALAVLIGAPALARAEGDAGYHQVAAIPLGAPDRWDYVVADAAGGRVYVAHGDRLSVVDGRTLKPVGDVTGVKGGAHGTYVAAAQGLGFTDDGEAGKAVAFDLKTLAVRATLDAAPDADAIAGDARRVYIVDGDSGLITVIDAAGPKVVTTIKVGGSLEAAVVDGRGHLFVNGAERGEIVRIDSWPGHRC